MKNKYGFTLLELLVCILIIVILVAFLLPALSRVSYTKKTIMCHNNLRQTVMAITAYVNDYKDLPVAYVRETVMSASGEPGLSYALDEYIDAPKPQSGKYINPWTCKHDTYYYMFLGGSYYYNPFFDRLYYTLPPILIYENIPLKPIMQDMLPRNDKTDIVRYDGSALEVGPSYYAADAGDSNWLQHFLRNP